MSQTLKTTNKKYSLHKKRYLLKFEKSQSGYENDMDPQSCLLLGGPYMIWFVGLPIWTLYNIWNSKY